MLLSYYDTYLNDNIIPERYDVISNDPGSDMTIRKNSPGTMNDVIINPTEPNDEEYASKLSPDDYYKIVKSLSEYSLHSKLITIGKELGFYKENNFDVPCNTLLDERIEIIKQYFSRCVGYKYNEHYTLNLCNGDNSPIYSKNVRKFTIDQVKKGKPVLLSYLLEDEHHAVIAYDYDSYTDKLYFHYGMHKNHKTHITYDNYPNMWYRTALSIDFKLPHVHSNNYAVTSVINNSSIVNYYCYHDCSIFTYNGSKEHMYYEYYEKYSDSKHKSYCKCGEYVLRPHAIKAGTTYNQNGNTYARCIDCGEIVNLDNNIVVIVMSNGLKKTVNGSFILPNGIYVINEKDIKNYINETLEFN